VNKGVPILGQAGLWMVLNFSDAGLSLMAAGGGAIEVNPVVQVFDMSSWEFTAYKLAMAVIAVVLLSHAGKMHLLRGLNIGMGCVCLWNGLMILLSRLL